MRKPRTTAFWVGRLPHWEVEDGRYFITLHLAGAIPHQGRQRLRKLAEELRKIDDRDTTQWLRMQRRIFAEMERWLDRAPTNRWLQDSGVAEMTVEALGHRAERGDWLLFEYTIMPTHLHLFCELGDAGMKAIMEDFKRWTGHRGIELLGLTGQRFWQREWFDHWSRSDEEDERIVRYIRNNPVKAGLCRHYSEWPYRGSFQ